MKSDKIIDAIGLIDDEIIIEAHNIIKRKRISKKVIFSLVAALIILFALGITAVAKEYNYNLDFVLYDTFSYVAEKIRPINLS